MIDLCIHIVLLIALPPLLPGVVAKTKAVFAGRKGPSVFQLYYDIRKLMLKGVAISETTTWIFIAAPVVSTVCIVLAGLFVPSGQFDAPIVFAGDLLLFAYLLGLARFFTTLAALDTGSSFEGMGASREVTFACLSEPALFLALLALAKLSGSLSLNGLLHGPIDAPSIVSAAALPLVAIGLFIVLLAENCRIPIDDPNTHLELTMIHEVMVLDHSGPLLGMILYGASIKLFVIGSLFLHVVAPIQFVSTPLGWAVFVGLLIALAVAVGVVESVMARLRMRHVPALLTAAVLFCGFGLLLLTRWRL